MNYQDFLNRVIDDGIEAAIKDYSRPEQRHKLKGSIAGFEACRGLSPSELEKLLNDAKKDTKHSKFSHYDNQPSHEGETYWYWRCKEVEIEWVCNVVSSLLVSQGRSVIIIPTIRGMQKASDILGIRV